MIDLEKTFVYCKRLSYRYDTVEGILDASGVTSGWGQYSSLRPSSHSVGAYAKALENVQIENRSEGVDYCLYSVRDRHATAASSVTSG